jgi:hypothetical protein
MNNQSILNMDFLRSGSEFSPEPVRKNMLAMKASSTNFKGRHARLEEFYNSTLKQHAGKHKVGSLTTSKVDQAAAETMDMWDGLSTHSQESRSVPSVINLDFLRSGQEFIKSQNVNSDHESRVPTNRNKRLDNFYSKTLEAFKDTHGSDSSEHLDCWDGLSSKNVVRMDEKPPSVINMDFLRSGGEFTAPVGPMSHLKDFETRQRSGSHSRLEQFYARTLAVHQ